MAVLFIDAGGNKGQSLVDFYNFIKKNNDEKELVLDAICIEPSIDKEIIIPLKKEIDDLKSEQKYRNINLLNLVLNSDFNPVSFLDDRQSGFATISQKFLREKSFLIDKFKLKIILCAIAKLFMRIYIEKPRKVSSVPLDICIPHESQYSSYYLKLDIEGAEYSIFNDNNLELLRKNPPEKIFIEFNTLKSGKRYYETLELFNKLKNIAPLYYLQCNDEKHKEQHIISEYDIFSWYSNDISLIKSLSLRGKETLLIRFFKKIFNIQITISSFNKCIYSTYLMYQKKDTIASIKREILTQANSKNSLFMEINRDILLEKINILKDKFDALKVAAIFVNNYSDETSDLTTFSKISNNKNILYSYLKDVSLIKNELIAIDKIIQSQLRIKGIDFLHIAGVNLRASYPNQTKLAHTLKWHRDYNGWFVLKAFIPLQNHSEPFLEYVNATHRKNKYYTFPSRIIQGMYEGKTGYISTSNISIVNTSCLHREFSKNNYSETLTITYLAHPDYNSSDFKLNNGIT